MACGISSMKFNQNIPNIIVNYTLYLYFLIILNYLFKNYNILFKNVHYFIKF